MDPNPLSLPSSSIDKEEISRGSTSSSSSAFEELVFSKSFPSTTSSTTIVDDLSNNFKVKTLQTYTYLSHDPITREPHGISEQHVCFPGAPLHRLKEDGPFTVNSTHNESDNSNLGPGPPGTVVVLSLYRSLRPLQDLTEGFFELDAQFSAVIGSPECQDLIVDKDSEEDDALESRRRLTATAIVCRLLFTYEKSEIMRAEKKGKYSNKGKGKHNSSKGDNFKGDNLYSKFSGKSKERLSKGS